MSAEREARFKAAVAAIIDRGEHPSGVRIRKELGRQVGSGMLGTTETRWRRELLELLGWTKPPGPGGDYRTKWRGPQEEA